MTAGCQARLRWPKAASPTLCLTMARTAHHDPPLPARAEWRSQALVVAVVLLAIVCAMCSAAEAATGDPAGRVGRISLANGSVDAIADTAADWEPASLNVPVSTGTALSGTQAVEIADDHS